MTTIEKVIYKEGETNLQTTVYVDENGTERCAYTFPYPKGVDKTVAKYLEENPDCVYMSFKEALQNIEKAKEGQYIKPWKEIIEDQWMEALECLPPQKWQTVNGVELFRMCEYTTGNITAHYGRIDGRFFCANRRTSDAYETLAAQVQEVA